MINAVIYARYSSYNQTERSIEGQLEDCQAYCRRKGYTIVGTYIDRAKSGTEADHRDDFQRLIRASSSKRFQIVVVWKMDRFSRSRYDFAVYKSKLKQNGVTVESVNEPSSTDPSGILLDSLIEGMAEYYSKNLSQNILRGQRVARSRGTWTGGNLPYGYSVTPDRHIVENPAESAILREVFQRVADGESQTQVVRDLNARGYRDRRNKPFTVSSFQNALRNTKYCGEFIKFGESYPDLYPVLISRELFDAVQSRFSSNRHNTSQYKANHDYILRGKAFCGDCGASLIGDCGKSKTGDRHFYYSCSNKKHARTCKKKSERAADLESDIITQTIDYIKSPGVIDTIAEGLRAEYERAFPDTEEKALEATIARLDHEIDNALTVLTTAKLSPALMDRMSQKAEALQAQRDDAQHDLDVLKITYVKSASVSDYKQLILDILDGDPADPDYRRRIVSTFINAVYVYDDHLLIYYTVDPDQPPTPFSDASEDTGSRGGSSTAPGSDGMCVGGATRIASEPCIKSYSIFFFNLTKIKSSLRIP